MAMVTAAVISLLFVNVAPSGISRLAGGAWRGDINFDSGYKGQCREAIPDAFASHLA